MPEGPLLTFTGCASRQAYGQRDKGFARSFALFFVLGSRLRFECLATLCLIALGLSPLALAHPNHDAVAEADWNSKTKSLEFSLRLTPHELERALSEKHDKAVDLDEEKSLPLLKSFIEESVRIFDQNGDPVEMSWVGTEIKVRSAWIYFEFRLGKGGPVGCKLTNTVFFDRFDDQKNTVALRLKEGEARRFFRFSKEKPSVRIEKNETPEESKESSGK